MQLASSELAFEEEKSSLNHQVLYYGTQAAKAAVVDFYETLRYEVKDDVGVTVATHGWVGGDAGGGKFTLEEGAAEMQWKEDREVCRVVLFFLLNLPRRRRTD